MKHDKIKQESDNSKKFNIGDVVKLRSSNSKTELNVGLYEDGDTGFLYVNYEDKTGSIQSVRLHENQLILADMLLLVSEAVFVAQTFDDKTIQLSFSNIGSMFYDDDIFYYEKGSQSIPCKLSTLSVMIP